MGALNGSLSASKFYVRGDLPKDVRRSFTERMRLRVFQPLRPEEDAEERMGWCALGQALDLELAPDKLFNGPYLTAALRFDRYRFPPAIVKAELAEAARALREKRAQERLSRTQKDELKQRVMRGLRKRYPPQMKAVDLVWNLDRKELYFWSQSEGMRERLGALFELSFGLELVLDSPFISALQCLRDEALEARLREVTASVFHGSGDGPG